MSKSTGTFVRAATYLKHLNPTYLRYYYASKLGPKVDDLDLNLDEFASKVNSDLVGKVVNLASRTARFVEQTGLSQFYPDDGGLFASAADAGGSIADAYEACDYNRAMRQDHAAGRSGKSIRRRQSAVDIAKRTGTCVRLAKHLHDRAEFVSTTGGLSCAGATEARRTNRRIAQCIQSRTGINQQSSWSALQLTNFKTCSPESNPHRCKP